VETRWIGKSIPRVEDEELLRGAARYINDIYRPGEVHATFVRSLHAHARITGFDLEAARRMPGVLGVFTHEDVGGRALPPYLWDIPPRVLLRGLEVDIRHHDQTLLPRDKVRYVGEAIAMVVAESRYVAEDAADMVGIDYDLLPVASTMETALRSDAPRIHEHWDDNVAVRLIVRKGDVDDAFGRAHHVVRDTFSMQRQAGIPIETRGAVAEWDPATRELTVWSSTQNVHPLRNAIAAQLDLPAERVRVIAPSVGGGFGVKAILYPEDLLVAWAAMSLEVPVKWIEDRIENLQSAIHAREQTHDIALAVSAEGEILGLKDSFTVDTGGFNALGLVIPYNTIAHLMGPYRVPSMQAQATAVVTNKTPTAPYRGAGRPEAVFAMERILDRAARDSGIDPVEFRARNLVRADEMPFDSGISYRDGQPLVLDSGNYPEALERAVKMVDYDAVKAQQRSGRRAAGVGVASYVEGTGIGPFESAYVRIDPRGRVLVSTGASSQGQGHRTVFAQICADHLDVDMSSIEIIGGDTKDLPFGWGTLASRSTVVAGTAVAEASAEVRKKILSLSSKLLEVSPDDLTIENGVVKIAGVPGRELSLQELAAAARPGKPFFGDTGGGLIATSYFEPPTVTWAHGTHAAQVEIDMDTGVVEIKKYVVVHDCGTVINPTLVEGQVHGGVAQGLGQALLEEIVYDEDGQLRTGTLMDYLVPTSEDVPEMILDHMESPSPLNPLGVKGVGEGGAIPAPAVLAGAVEDALSEFGVVVRRTPLTPAYVLELIHGHISDGAGNEDA
jgi:aerobic carbon-monoxide dehydrogenase large subunit